MNMEEEKKQDLVAAAKALPPMENFSLRPRSFEEAYRFANVIAESDLVPDAFRKKPANVLVAVQLGMELGVSPMQALQNIAVINGRPAIWGDLLPAIVLASGLLEQIDESDNGETATCVVKRRGFAPITRTFSMDDAKRAGLADKTGPWKQYPKRMRQMRARAFAFRDMFADVLKGVQVREEVEDIETTATRVEVEPMKMPKAIEKTAPANAGRVAEPTEPAGKKKAVEASPEDRKAAALTVIAEASAEEFAELPTDWLTATIQGLSMAEQLDVCRAYNERKQAKNVPTNPDAGA